MLAIISNSYVLKTWRHNKHVNERTVHQQHCDAVFYILVRELLVGFQQVVGKLALPSKFSHHLLKSN